MTSRSVGARALLVSAAFFDYEKDIVNEFERQGYETTFIDERPSNSAAARAILRVRRDLVGRQIERYYRQKWSEVAGAAFDLVLVIKGEVVPRWFLENLRNSNKGARFVFYSWDALDNAKNCISILDCFNELLSFDSDDVAAWPDFSYLPLFYTKDFAPLPMDQRSTPRRFALSFVGTLHTERYAFVKPLFEGRARTFAFYYVQARWYFAAVKYLSREHRGVPWNEVSFQKLTRQQVAQIFRNSSAVLDIPRQGQSGMTMRTFEVLASGAVLVTTNAAITREPFFDPARVLVLPREFADQGPDDLRAQLDKITPADGPPDLFDNYSLESWVRAIIGGQKDTARSNEIDTPS